MRVAFQAIHTFSAYVKISIPSVSEQLLPSSYVGVT